jgi:hypothetical protein
MFESYIVFSKNTQCIVYREELIIRVLFNLESHYSLYRFQRGVNC